ncbi:DUF4328 domain-containing protein [Pseudomonas sp. Marseille-P9899]|uniref:DUF4328 domain-containing protein n=1 Tax=Pseudomonas sp. Marseille-P9899 TaxID=2730401 RepID=UPI00158E403C|nr:DUF4328 domain-containing protein [Pseudomonas sp. Marseille-P9899]
MTDFVAVYGERFTWLFWLWLLFVVAGSLFNQLSGRRANASIPFLVLVLGMVAFDASVLLAPSKTLPAEQFTSALQLLQNYALAFVAALIHCCWFAWQYPRGRTEPARRVKVVKTFVEMDGLTALVRWALYAQILLAVAGTVCNVMGYGLVSNYELGVYLSLDEAMLDEQANSERWEQFGLWGFAVMLVSAFLMLRWIHRASFNAWQLNGAALRLVPGKVVAAFFIPPMMLWRPWQAMNEIWAVSHAPNASDSVRPGALPLCWWLSWVLVVVLGWLLFLSAAGTDLAQQKLTNLLGVAFNTSLSCLAVASLALVARIHAVQALHGLRAVPQDPPNLAHPESARA